MAVEGRTGACRDKSERDARQEITTRHSQSGRVRERGRGRRWRGRGYVDEDGRDEEFIDVFLSRSNFTSLRRGKLNATEND